MSLTRNRILPWGVLTAAALFPAAAPAQPVTYTGSGFVFPDNDPAGATGTVTVPDGFTLGAVSVSINFAGVTDPARHTWAGDVTATLSNGTSTITLFQRLGKTAVGTGFGDDSNLNGTYTFADSATLRLIDSAKTVGGTDAAAGDIPVGSYWATNNTFNGDATSAFSGEQAQNFASTFGGQVAAGTWTLFVSDEAAGDNGSVAGWSLTLTPVPEPGTLALCGAGLAGVVAYRRRRAG